MSTSSIRGYSDTKKGMAALLNVEPATRTLDFVRFLFHFCNTVNFTLGAIAFGVGIGYDLVLINIAHNSDIDKIKNKFLVTGGLVALHGLIGAYGCVMKQGRCLILYGCLGACLLILGPVAGWVAYLNSPSISKQGGKIFETSYFNQTAENRTEKENYLLKILLAKNCQMDHLVDINFTLSTKTEQLKLDSANRKKPSCIAYVRDRTRMRIRTMYTVLFLLSATQSVCMICDILFIFWTLKEESDIERRKSPDSSHILETGSMLSKCLCCDVRKLWRKEGEEDSSMDDVRSIDRDIRADVIIEEEI